MGLRFRKSKKLGPFRINFSKSGIGYSVGGKGFRYTKTADGKRRKTYSIPGTGISYVDEKRKKKNNGGENMDRISPKKAKTKTILKGILIFFIIYGLLGACTEILSDKEDIKIENITLSGESTLTIDINQDKEIYFEISPKDAKRDIDVSTSSTNLKAKVEDDKIIITSNSTEGTYSLIAKSDDIESNRVTINVVDSVKKAQEEQRQAELQEQQRQAELQRQEEQAQASNENNETYVYVSSSGSKYHSNSSCSNMKNPSKITKTEAESRGLLPCKKCY